MAMTDEEIKQEIEALRVDPAVKLAQKELNYKRKRMQYVYHLRHLKHRGEKLMEMGMTLEAYDFSEKSNEEEEE